MSDSFAPIAEEHREHTPAKYIREQLLAKYDELHASHPSESFHGDTIVRDTPAYNEYCSFYTALRLSRVKGLNRSQEYMNRHACWHLKQALERRRENAGKVRKPRAKRTAVEQPVESSN